MSKSYDQLPANNNMQPANTVFEVDFKWNKMKALVSEKNPQTNTSTPKYIVDYHAFKCTALVFHPYEDPKAVIGTGTLHPVTIHATYELHGQKGTIKALKRFMTSYTHLSYNYSNNPDGTPAAMTWASASSFKTWDFICLDEQQSAVAKFSANCWALNNIGCVEFLGPKANDPAAREEILVTGMTLCYQMILRTTNFLNLGGAIFARTGPLDKEAAPKKPMRNGDGKSIKELEATSGIDTGLEKA
ncbi:hypothetical protein FCIRC_4183 [Fusarium circinatum]|uniref:Uncharacterized protein n=1 Tax=Fusarium circinatum TaxID=48490 RepID=A0A8H5UA31_FUSCI|nr:hypothetical protein FCIRC_4183 [Fusarium circinatum]